MADNETDLLIDGKSVYSLRVVDLKQELKKRDIPFKTNASKAQLQSLIIEHLSQCLNTNEDDKSSEENSRLTTHSEDTNETIESNSEANNVQTVDNKRGEQQSEATDLSQDSGITSSVSFGEKSIKLTIKLQPNDSPTKQLSPRMSPRMSPKKSPTKEMKSPVIMEELSKQVIEDKPKEITPEVPQHIPSAQMQDTNQKEVIPQNKAEEIVEQKTVEETPPKPVEEPVVEEPKQSIPEEKPKASEPIQVISESESLKAVDSSVDSKETEEKSEEKMEKKQTEVSPKDESNKDVVEDNIVISEEVSDDLIEQKNESSGSEKESLNSSQNTSEDKTKDSPIDEPITQKSEEKREKSAEKENKSIEPKEEKVKERPPRRRRWGGSVSNDSQQNARKGISSDQLKGLIPDLDSTDNSSTASKVSKSDSIVVTSSLSKTQTTEANHEIPPKRDIRVVRKSVSIPEDDHKISAEDTVKTTQLSEQKTIIVVPIESESKSESETKREVSPPRNAETNIVFIRNLVRPFTLLQLKDILGQTGKLIEERFWIDKIKSKCFATYETVEEAVATRLKLHGTRWPTSNPKLLSVDFATKEDLDSHLSPELTKDLNNKKNDTEVNQKYDIVIRSEEQRTALREKENKNDSRPIREWDRDKLVTQEEERKNKRRPNSPTALRSRSRERDPKKRKIGEERVRAADSTSEQEAVTETVKRAESPAKLLDDLFRKTTSTPSIYWLPLTEEQAVARVALKEEEEKKRTEDRIAREEQFRKRQEERRAFDGPPPPFRNERNQWRTDSPPNRRNFGRRGSPPRRSPPPNRRSPLRRRSPANRFSRSRSPVPRRKR